MFRDALTVALIVALMIVAWPVYLLMVVGSRRAVHDHYGT